MTLLKIHEPVNPQTLNKSKNAIGIDFGTTNSVIAIAYNQKSIVLKDQYHQNGLVPSVIYYGNNSIIIGKDAVEHIDTEPKLVVSSIKRLMGRNIQDINMIDGIPLYNIVSSQKDGVVKLKVGTQIMTPVEISANLLKKLCLRAEKILKKQCDCAVITVPAYFDDAAREATKDAAKKAGIEVLRLINEPTAAALAYGIDKKAEGLYAIYDLGGGTFDISFLNMEKGIFQVKATGGDTTIGGDDFDQKIAEYILSERKAKNITDNINISNLKNLLKKSREIKERLTNNENYSDQISLNGIETHHVFNCKDFNNLIHDLVLSTINIISEIMISSNILLEDIEGVVLVGGSTRIPLVRKTVSDFFRKDPLDTINPDQVVAMGAALHAEALTIGSDNLLLDITPLSLGIETMGGLVEKIIERNTPIPVSKYQEFTTYKDKQTSMTIHILQGEKEEVIQCRSLAKFILHNIPVMSAGKARIHVEFNVDADGILTVSAFEKTCGIKQEISIKPTYGLNITEITNLLH